MTRVEGKRLIIESEGPGRCELCGQVAELRPYGPKGERVCFPCGMKDPAAAGRAADRLVDSVEEVQLREGLVLRKADMTIDNTGPHGN